MPNKRIGGPWSKTRFNKLFRNPFFWILTFVGFGTILGGSLLLWIFEGTAGGGKIGYLDCVLWSAGNIYAKENGS